MACVVHEKDYLGKYFKPSIWRQIDMPMYVVLYMMNLHLYQLPCLPTLIPFDMMKVVIECYLIINRGTKCWLGLVCLFS